MTAARCRIAFSVWGDRSIAIRMKKNLSRYFLQGFFLILIGCSNAAYRDGIANVLAQRAKLRKECVLKYSNPPLLDDKRYSAALRKIDTSHCPKDFQLAWLDYVQVWECFADYGLPGMALDLVLLKQLDGSQLERRSRSRDTKEAWNKVERIALYYGVRAQQP